jgi:hypothetical protein
MGKSILSETARVCGYGHVMDEANSYVRKDTGVAVCRKCSARRVKAWYGRNKVQHRARSESTKSADRPGIKIDLVVPD